SVSCALRECCLVFVFNDPSPPWIYTLSLHDALPILIASITCLGFCVVAPLSKYTRGLPFTSLRKIGKSSRILFMSKVFNLLPLRSEEHTSELQSREKLVCRLLLEKKKTLITGSHAQT